MGFFEFLSGVVGAIVGAVVAGAVRLFGGKREEEQPPPRIQPVQRVIAIAPARVIQWEVLVTDEVRDILKIPRSQVPNATQPKLLLPGEGVVTPDKFIGYAFETMLTDTAEPVVCVACNKAGNRGAFFDTRWFCTTCFYVHVKEMALGKQGLFTGAVVPQTHTWDDIQKMLSGSPGVALLSQDATLRQLAACATDAGGNC